jgi:hypothetical protein
MARALIVALLVGFIVAPTVADEVEVPEEVRNELVGDPPSWVLKFFTRSLEQRDDCRAAYVKAANWADTRLTAAREGRVSSAVSKTQLRTSPNPLGKTQLATYVFPTERDKRETVDQITQERKELRATAEALFQKTAWPIPELYDQRGEKLRQPVIEDAGTFAFDPVIVSVVDSRNAVLQVPGNNSRFWLTGIGMDGRIEGQEIPLAQIGEQANTLFRVISTRKVEGRTLFEIAPFSIDDLRVHIFADRQLVYWPKSE